ncbi:hypothetical protein ACFQ14_00195 [Pseudahrensia aquimaris]|uniref:Uncharacterized protein n=1 Tax=Pseudahrensia aquimaris TaxID=744461 RepID=A0ABW3FDE4_9HYPH
MKSFHALICCCALATSLICNAAMAQQTDAGWLEELRFDMQFNHDCEVAYFLNIVERNQSEGLFVSARVMCADGRSFDASKKANDEEFSVEACGVATCEATIEGRDQS